MPQTIIDKWRPSHGRWQELVHYIEAHRLARGVIDEHSDPPSRILLVATRSDQIVGFLMFLVQPIGPEMEVPTLHDAHGRVLTEAKIRGFFVSPTYRSQGIGTALQRRALDAARELGCYQVRSRSSLEKAANYSIKLKLGFACHPAVREVRGEEEVGVYWVKCVREA